MVPAMETSAKEQADPRRFKYKVTIEKMGPTFGGTIVRHLGDIDFAFAWK